MHLKKVTRGVLLIFITYGLCLFYSGLVCLRFVIQYLTQKNSRFWITKDHSKRPSVLTDPKYGRHEYATVNGVKLHYVSKGCETKPLMLFVHGFTDFWYSWRHQITEFSKDYRTVAVDMRGYGDSDKPFGISAYKMAHLSTDLKCLVEHLGYKKCVLVTHDFGALIAWTFIRNHMDMIDRYIILAGPAPVTWVQTVTISWHQFRLSWYVFMYQMPGLAELTVSSNDFAGVKVIAETEISETFTSEDSEAYKYTFARAGALSAPINYYRANLWFFPTSAPPAAPVRHAPGLFLCPEHDNYISQDLVALTKRSMKNIECEIVEGANHFLHQNAPEATNARMRRFLDNTVFGDEPGTVESCLPEYESHTKTMFRRVLNKVLVT